MDKKLQQTIRKWALQNAIKYNGTANPGAVIGKILQEHPEIKSKLKTLSKDIQTIIKDVNSTDNKKQIEELKKLDPKLLEDKPKEKRKGLKPIKNAKQGKFKVRIEPSPSGPLHIGHAYGVCINSEYAKMYGGKMILRIADTNPENIYIPAYELIEEDANWLTKNNISKVYIQSSRLATYHKYAEELINKEHAYICTCNPDEFKELINNKKACPCRDLKKSEQQTRWKKMFKEFKPGEAVMRIKTDVTHKNPAMRDWPAVRINTSPHPKTKTQHRVWPLMNFSVAIDDHEMEITHVINGKEHLDNSKRQEYIYKYFNWTRPEYINWGRINFKGFEVSASKTKEKILRNEFEDWDDIRLPFMPALRRRGYQPEAFTKFAVETGISLTDKTVSMGEFFKTINSFNKEIIESMANRYFFIEDKFKIKIKNAPEQNIELNLHPDNPKKGKRKLKTKQEFYIAVTDANKLKNNKLYRLMDCLNFKKHNSEFVFENLDYQTFKKNGEMIMHWLPVEKDLIPVEIKMSDNSILKGLAESSIKNEKPGNIVQFERRFFARLDKKTKDKLTFWFTHK